MDTDGYVDINLMEELSGTGRYEDVEYVEVTENKDESAFHSTWTIIGRTE